MSISRTDIGRKVWVCRQTKELIKAFGGQECTASFLDLGLSTIKKWPDVKEPGNLTLMSLLKLEEELVSIGLEPVFALEHLRSLGYTSRQLSVKTTKPQQLVLSIWSGRRAMPSKQLQKQLWTGRLPQPNTAASSACLKSRRRNTRSITPPTKPPSPMKMERGDGHCNLTSAFLCAGGY